MKWLGFNFILWISVCIEIKLSTKRHLTCGWFIKAITQKLGIFEMSSERFLKWGCLNWLYLCSTLRISSLACSFNLSISFCTSSIFSIASCCSLSAESTNMQTCVIGNNYWSSKGPAWWSLYLKKHLPNFLNSNFYVSSERSSLRESREIYCFFSCETLYSSINSSI